jgi:hypothetical protein
MDIDPLSFRQNKVIVKQILKCACTWLLIKPVYHGGNNNLSYITCTQLYAVYTELYIIVLFVETPRKFIIYLFI